MHYPGQQDEGKDDQHKPRKEQHDARDGAPAYSLGHGRQLPAGAAVNREI
jgi:hypothetical protein